MAETTFKVRYDGPAVQDGTMGARDFANALLGLADTITIASDTLGISPDATPQIKIKDIREGSFLYEVLLVSEGLNTLEIAWEALKGENATAIANLGAILALTSGGYHLTRKIGGRAIKSIKKVKDSKDIELTLDDGEKILTTEQTATLVQNPNFVTAARKSVAPLKTEGVTAMQLETGNDEDPQIMERVVSNEVPAFEPRRDDLPTTITEEELTIRFKEIKFEGKGKWAITDDEHSYQVKIADEEFLARLENDLAIRKRDYFKVLLRREQIPHGTGFKNEYTIIKVLKEFPASGILTELPFE